MIGHCVQQRPGRAVPELCAMHYCQLWEHKPPSQVPAASVWTGMGLGGLATPASGCAETPDSNPHSSVTAGTSLAVSFCHYSVM